MIQQFLDVQVKVAVHTAGINFGDILKLVGQYQEKPTLPFSPGRGLCRSGAGSRRRSGIIQGGRALIKVRPPPLYLSYTSSAFIRIVARPKIIHHRYKICRFDNDIQGYDLHFSKIMVRY